MRGEMGSGKTTFARAVSGALGADERMISSPTFVVVNEYPCVIQGDKGRVIHVDAYRLNGQDDTESLGWDTLFGKGGEALGNSVAMVEWPERIEELLARNGQLVNVRIRATGAGERGFEFDLPRAWLDRPGAALFLERAVVACPITGEMVSPVSPSYPFISEKARLADLNRWFTGAYSSRRDLSHEDMAD